MVISDPYLAWSYLSWPFLSYLSRRHIFTAQLEMTETPAELPDRGVRTPQSYVELRWAEEYFSRISPEVRDFLCMFRVSSFSQLDAVSKSSEPPPFSAPFNYLSIGLFVVRLNPLDDVPRHRQLYRFVTNLPFNALLRDHHERSCLQWIKCSCIASNVSVCAFGV